LQSIFLKYTKKEINGWENIFSNEIIIDASNPKKNPLLTSAKKIKPCDLMKITPIYIYI
jgi:hypothetical protein